MRGGIQEVHLRIEPRWVFWGSVGFILVGIGVAATSNAIFSRWPLDVWRMDMDDFLTSIGAVGIGVGAFMQGRAAWHRANEAHDKAETNGDAEKALERREENDYQDLRDRIARLEDDDG
jgi:hypothetical protein